MANLEGKAAFEGVECSFPFKRCIRQGSVEVPRLWLKMATQILWNVEENWRKRKMGGPHWDSSRRIPSNVQLYEGGQLLDTVTVKRALETDGERIGERGRWVGYGAKTYEQEVDKHEEELENLVVDTATGQYELSFAENS